MPPRDPRPDRLIEITLDDSGLPAPTPEVEQERQVAIFDLLERKVKTGIAHRHLKPYLGIVDPENTRTQPAAVAASAGLAVLSHALESYTAIPFDRRPRPARPIERPAYQGANPISDIWSLRALEIVAEFLPRAVADPSDDDCGPCADTVTSSK